MATITLDIDDELHRGAERAAARQNTTVSRLVQTFLASVAGRDQASRNQAADLLGESFLRLGRSMGERNWARDDLQRRPNQEPNDSRASSPG